jgi:hypothetical protein
VCADEGGHEYLGNLFYYFWINQETYVAPAEFQRLVTNALREEYLNPTGSGRQHVPELMVYRDGETEREREERELYLRERADDHETLEPVS